MTHGSSSVPVPELCGAAITMVTWSLREVPVTATVIRAAPAESADTNPLLETPTTEGALEFHTRSSLMAACDPSDQVPVAVSCSVSPKVTEGAPGEMLMETSVGVGSGVSISVSTLTGVLAVNPNKLAVMSVVPV